MGSDVFHHAEQNILVSNLKLLRLGVLTFCYNRFMSSIKFKNDKYKKVRGGYSRLLDIQCAKCKEHLLFYQKDGPGILKRMYLDRIFESPKYSGLENQLLNPPS